MQEFLLAPAMETELSMVCLHEQLDTTWALRPPSITSVVLVVSHLVLALGVHSLPTLPAAKIEGT